jgi:perosamine synthetase
LELSVRALDIGPGDEVIIPNFTIISCASAVLLTGAIPVIVDVKFEDMCIDVSKIEAAITAKTKAIMAVHIYGYAADMKAILELARKYSLKVIEDAAEMHGGELEIESNSWKRAGSFGDVSTFSFFVNKLISTGEGGMLLTDDSETANRLKLLRNLGFTTPRYLHSIQGFNYRMTGLQASLGVSQVSRISEILKIKSRVYQKYMHGLSGLEEYVKLPSYPSWIKSSYWVFPIVVSKEDDRDNLVQFLSENGVETRNFFISMTDQPYLKGKFIAVGELKNSQKLSKSGLYIPSGLGLSVADQDFVINKVKSYFIKKYKI